MSNNNSWDLFLVKAKEVGKAVGDVASDVVDSSRHKLDELKTKNELEEANEALGRMYYASVNGGEADSEKMNAKMDEITALKARLAELNASGKKKEKEPLDVACPHCGGLNRKGSTYCSFCGKSMQGE